MQQINVLIESTGRPFVLLAPKNLTDAELLEMVAWMTGGGLPRHGEPRPLLLIVSVVAEGVTVDGGVIVSRNGARRHDRSGKETPHGLGQTNLLGLHHRTHPRLEDGKRLAMRETVLVEHKAIVAELCRHFRSSPRWSRTKSAIRAISSI